MGAQSLNTEIRPRLKEVQDVFTSGLFKKMRSGIDNAADCAKTSGSTKLIKSCEAAREGTESMITVFNSLMDCVDRYEQQLRKVEEALS